MCYGSRRREGCPSLYGSAVRAKGEGGAEARREGANARRVRTETVKCAPCYYKMCSKETRGSRFRVWGLGFRV